MGIKTMQTGVLRRHPRRRPRRRRCSTASTGSRCRPTSASSPASASCRSSRARRDRARRRALVRLATDPGPDQRVLALGRGQRPAHWPRRSTASSSGCCSRSACTTSGTCRSSSRSAVSRTPPARSCTATSPASSPATRPPASSAGAFLFKMFGLPAAAIAIWHSAQPGEPRSRRRHHDLGGADLLPDRHHRADRVRVPVRRAAALRAARAARGLAQFIANTLRHAHGLHLLPGRHRLRAVQRARQERPEVVAGAGPRAALRGALLRDLPRRDPLLRPEDARSRDRGRRRRADLRRALGGDDRFALRGGWWPPSAARPISPTSTPASPA